MDYNFEAPDFFFLIFVFTFFTNCFAFWTSASSTADAVVSPAAGRCFFRFDDDVWLATLLHSDGAILPFTTPLDGLRWCFLRMRLLGWTAVATIPLALNRFVVVLRPGNVNRFVDALSLFAFRDISDASAMRDLKGMSHFSPDGPRQQNLRNNYSFFLVVGNDTVDGSSFLSSRLCTDDELAAITFSSNWALDDCLDSFFVFRQAFRLLHFSLLSFSVSNCHAANFCEQALYNNNRWFQRE